MQEVDRSCGEVGGIQRTLLCKSRRNWNGCVEDKSNTSKDDKFELRSHKCKQEREKTVGMTERQRVTFRRTENNVRDEATEQNRGAVDGAFGGQIIAFNTAAEFQFWPLFLALSFNSTVQGFFYPLWRWG